MNKILKISLSIIALAVSSTAIWLTQSNYNSYAVNPKPHEIVTIDSYVQQVDDGMHSYSMHEDIPSSPMAEGTSLYLYHDAGELVKAEVWHFDETSKTKDEIYFRNGRAIFVDRLENRYYRPSNIERPKVASLSRSRLYFKDGVLALWVKDGAAVGRDSEEFKSEAEEWGTELEKLGLHDSKNSK